MIESFTNSSGPRLKGTCATPCRQWLRVWLVVGRSTLDTLDEHHDSPIVFMRSLAVKVRSRAPVPVRACLFAQGTKGRLLSCGADAGEVCRITARSAVHDLAPGGAHVFCLQTGGQNQYFAIVIALHLTHVEDPEEHDDA